MIVVISAKAEQDLEEIGDYIARDDPNRAIAYIRVLRAKCLALADLPGRFPLVTRYEAQGVRRRVHGDHLIFYRAERDRIVILHVLHGARDYAAMLFPS